MEGTDVAAVAWIGVSTSMLVMEVAVAVVAPSFVSMQSNNPIASVFEPSIFRAARISLRASANSPYMNNITAL